MTRDLLFLAYHGAYEGGPLPIIVTLVGWLLVIRSLVWMFLPARTLRRLIAALKLESNYPIFAVVSLLIGAYLTYEGFVR